MNSVNNKLEDVFGLVRGLPLTYVEREHVDKPFLRAINSRKHIVIRGGSKQGKTSLRKRHLKGNTLAIQCQIDWEIRDIHLAILRSAGFSIVEEKATAEKTRKISLQFGSAFLGDPVKGRAEAGKASKNEISRKSIDIDLDNVGDIVSGLQSTGFNGFIVLDDFHYLPKIVQSKFSILLKAFHELSSSLTFVIIGVWKEENRLLSMNGDLAGRLIDIGVDIWNDDDLERIISSGEELLGIKIHPDFTKHVIENCHGSAYILQEACNKLCEDNDIFHTQPFKRTIGNHKSAVEILESIKKNIDPRYSGFISNFINLREHSIDNSNKPPKKDYLSLLYLIITSRVSDLRNGIHYNVLFDIRKNHFHDPQHAQRLKDMLLEIPQAQTSMSIRPVIVGYNSNTQVIEFLDREFLFWLSQCDQNKMLSDHRMTFLNNEPEKVNRGQTQSKTRRDSRGSRRNRPRYRN